MKTFHFTIITLSILCTSSKVQNYMQQLLL